MTKKYHPKKSSKVITCPINKQKIHCSQIEESEAFNLSEDERIKFCSEKCLIYKQYVKKKGKGCFMGIKNKKAIESSISNAIIKFLQDQCGEQTEQITTELLKNTIEVRIKNNLYPAEKNLVRKNNGKKMIKKLKEKLIERARPLLEVMIKNLTDADVIDIHSSFNPDTAERIAVFILSKNIDDIFDNSELSINKE